MVKINIPSIIVLMSTLLLSNVVYVKSEVYDCSKEDRVKDCSNADKKAVCGLFDQRIRCFMAPCGVTFSSACEACLDETVAQVEDRSCEEIRQEIFNKRYKHYCTEEEKKAEICTMDYTPVCGYNEDNSHRTYGNRCSACGNKNVVYTENGECN